MKIIELKETISTNNFAKEYIKNNVSEDDIIIYTHFQKQGRGTGRNSWHSKKSQNLLFSIITKPMIEAVKYFHINMSVTLSICEYLKIKGIDSKIKWSNDIYYKDEKLCGILIENIIYENLLKETIIGVGLNTNETNFPENLPNPISMKEIKKKNFDLKNELFSLSEIIINNLKKNYSKTEQDLKKEFLANLYRFGEFHNYKAQGMFFVGKIIDVEKLGNLVVETQNNEIKTFAYKEIEFII